MMKIVGLLSGGKDSCYNLVECVRQGHEPVALATLSPPEGKEEIDSYLYQTVGQDGIGYIAQALELPLFRRVITGQAVDQELQYRSAVEGDETEDLYMLIREVLDAHPEVKGVAVGAILSTYQRIRVEHVCGRLGLTSLAYLWQRDQMELLQDMKADAMDSRLIKVAGAGLTTRHLGQNVASEAMIADLTKLHERFGLHPCGEGGEYETFTVDCPLFKHRIELLETEVVYLSSPDADKYSIVAYLRIKAARLVDKEDRFESPLGRGQQFDDVFAGMRSAAALALQDHPLDEDNAATSKTLQPTSHGPSTTRRSDWLALHRIDALGGPNVAAVANISIEDEVTAAFANLATALQQESLSVEDLVHVNFYLSDMSLFAAANSAYKAVFPKGSPPTRATVAVGLSGNKRVEIDALACRKPKKVLHVQSISHWAPANIGPYSQAASVDGVHFIAGQIGLVPASLTLPADDASQFALAAQHVSRIQQEVAPSARLESCICWLAAGQWSRLVGAARSAWTTWKQDASIIFVEALTLPRDALVEWQCTLAEQPSKSARMRVWTELPELPFDDRAGIVSVRMYCRPGLGADDVLRCAHRAFGEQAATSLVQVDHLASLTGDNLQAAYVTFSA